MLGRMGKPAERTWISRINHIVAIPNRENAISTVQSEGWATGQANWTHPQFPMKMEKKTKIRISHHENILAAIPNREIPSKLCVWGEPTDVPSFSGEGSQ